MSDYAQQKLFQAVEALIGEGSLQQRLAYARDPIVVLRSHPALPAVLAGRVNQIADRLSAANHQLIETTPDREAQVIASEILSLFEESMRLR